MVILYLFFFFYFEVFLDFYLKERVFIYTHFSQCLCKIKIFSNKLNLVDIIKFFYKIAFCKMQSAKKIKNL